MEGIKRVG